MQTPALDDRPPRFYQMVLQKDLLGGWTLVREWGFQGASGRVVRDHFDSWDEASQVMVRLRDTQLGRGYRVMFMQGQEQPQ